MGDNPIVRGLPETKHAVLDAVFEVLKNVSYTPFEIETTSVVTLDPKLEQKIMSCVKQTEQGAYLNLDPDTTKMIISSVESEVKKMEEAGKTPIVITSPIVRIYFKRLTEDYFKDLIVVSYNEVESNVELQSMGMITA